MQIPDIRNAIHRLNEGSPEDARVVLQRMLDEMPDHAAARVLMARSYEAESRWASAALHWTVAARLCPGLAHVQSAAAEATLRAALDSDAAMAMPVMPFMPEPAETPPAAETPLASEAPPETDLPPTEEEAVHPSMSEMSAPPTDTVDWTEEAKPASAQPASASNYEDLDHLIEELEDARIVPDPDVDALPDDELQDDIDDVVSETLAKIYANQKYFVEAAEVYEKLADRKPDRRDEFLQRAEEMRGRGNSS